MIRDRGYGGSVVQLRRHVAAIRSGDPADRPARHTSAWRLPGEQAHVDWGLLDDNCTSPSLRPAGT
jgi:hypothetical protein